MKFYALEPDGLLFGTRWAYSTIAKPRHFGEPEYCPVCGSPVTLRRWLPPHRLILSSAKPEKWGDFLFGLAYPLMVSTRFKAIYEAEGLIGIKQFYPSAEIVRMGRKKTGDLPASPPIYHLVEILWNGANQDDVASKVVFKDPPRCSFCRSGGVILRQEGIILEASSWTGADIFFARGKSPVLVSERFKQVVESHKLKGAQFIPAEKYAYDERRPGLRYIRE